MSDNDAESMDIGNIDVLIKTIERDDFSNPYRIAKFMLIISLCFSCWTKIKIQAATRMTHPPEQQCSISQKRTL